MPDSNKEGKDTLNKNQQGKKSPNDKTSKTEKSLDKDKKSMTVQKALWRERALKAEKELEKLKPPEKKEEKNTEGAGSADQKTNRDERVDFLLNTIIKGEKVSEEEYDFISSFAKGAGISLEEARQREEVKLYLEARREKVAKDQKVPPPSSRSIQVAGKNVSEMSNEEIDQNYPQIVQRILDRKRETQAKI